MPVLFNKLSHFLFYLSIAFGGFWFVILGYLAFTIRPRFEKLFHDVWPTFSVELLRGGPKVGRFSDYLDMIYFYELEKSHLTRLYRLYGGFDFPAHITRFEFWMVKLSYQVMYTSAFLFALAAGIMLFFHELPRSDPLHYILYISIPTAFITGMIIAGPYFYLKRRIPARFDKILQETQPGARVFLGGYLHMLGNYSRQQRRNTITYRLLQSCDFMGRVTRNERRLGKLVWWGGMVFALSTVVSLVGSYIRIFQL